MRPDDFNWSKGEVIYWDMWNVNRSIPVALQLHELKEDLLQVRFENNTLLDVGWYPEFSPEGMFVLNVVRGRDWDDPLLKVECHSLPELYDAIARAIHVAERCPHE